MDLRAALKEQFRASVAMLEDCVSKCSDDLWVSGMAGRETWRIALHAAFFTQYGLAQDLASYRPWPGRPPGRHEEMWADPEMVEPYELPVGTEIYSREETLSYIAYIEGILDESLDRLDLESEDSGTPSYRNMSKVSHVLMTLRHLQGHVGQLSEILLSQSIDTVWVGKGSMWEWQRWEAQD